MKTSNEAERSIVDALDKILLDYGGTWNGCENCTFVSIDPMSYYDCRADRWRDCPVLTTAIKNLSEADARICGTCSKPFSKAWYCTRPDCPVCPACRGPGWKPERCSCKGGDSSPDPAQGNRAHR